MNTYKPNAKKEMIPASFYIEKDAHNDRINSLSKEWEVSRNEALRCVLDMGFSELERLEEDMNEHKDSSEVDNG